MAEQGGDSQEKTEDPTPRKREKAREQGQIASSKEMFVFGGMAGATLLLMFGQSLLPAVAGSWASYFVLEDPQNLDTQMFANMRRVLFQIFAAGMIVGIPLIAVILLIQSAVGGIVFAPQSIGFKPEKIDPIKGLKRMFSVQSLVELGKALLKVVLLVTAAAMALLPLLPDLGQMADLAPGAAMTLLGHGVLRLLTNMTIALAIVGGVDMAWQLHTNTKNLRMSRQELKDESKESEGSPEVKSQLRRLQMEASQRSASRRKALSDVPDATAIVTNPTHFAVALRYVHGESDAPRILALGRGPMAQEIKELGAKAGVNIVEVPPLARALYYTGDIGMEISEQLYAAVAVVLAHVQRLDMGQAGEMPEIELPPELHLDEFGQRMES